MHLWLYTKFLRDDAKVSVVPIAAWCSSFPFEQAMPVPPAGAQSKTLRYCTTRAIQPKPTLT